MKRLIALAALLISACSAAQDVPSSYVTYPVIDWRDPKWGNTNWSLQIYPKGNLMGERLARFDRAARVLSLAYNPTCNTDGHGAGGECRVETVYGAELGRWYVFDDEAPATYMRMVGNYQFQVAIDSGWRISEFQRLEGVKYINH